MLSLPTFSSTELDLPPTAYTTATLERLAKQAREKGHDTAPAPELPAGDWLHIHTLTIEASLELPLVADELRALGYQRDLPSMADYQRILALLGDGRDNSIPMTVVPPSSSLLGISKMTGYYGAPKGQNSFYLTLHDNAPSTVDADGNRQSVLASFERNKYHFLPLPRRHRQDDPLQIGASDQWFIKSDAFDTRTWLHAALSMDSTSQSTRKGKPLQDGIERFKLVSSVALSAVELDRAVVERGGEPVNQRIKMTVTIDVHANLETLSRPGPDLINEMTGYILHSLLPAHVPAYASAADARTAGIRDFFASLQPAPALPIGTRPNDLQPQAMRSRLLPFQQRTVHKLIQREKRTETGDEDEGDDASRQDPQGTWMQLPVTDTGKRYAYRRATGTVVKLPLARHAQSKKGKEKAFAPEEEEDEYGLTARDKASLMSAINLSTVRGTMLCEEMGLGKTVEAIGLMLLHRHPLSTAGDFFAKFHAEQTGNSDPAPSSRVISASSGAATRRTNKIHGSGSGADGSENSSVVDDIETPVINLHRGPPGVELHTFDDWLRNESAVFDKTKVYDETSKLDVTEVAATLIVTPPSLLKQWINEIHHHAPGVRVCVYEGWKPLQESARKRQAELNKGLDKRIAERKRKAQEKERSATVQKYAKKLKTKHGTAAATGAPTLVTERASRSRASMAGTESELGPPEVPVKRELDESVADQDEDEPKNVDDPATLLDVTQREFLRYVRAHDVVITTYGDLSTDLTVSAPAPTRSRRSNASYKLSERPRTPLLMAHWWRVCLDEVQMNSDSSAAADMVALIPRTNSLAISGTPAKTDIKDLIGSLRFLRVPNVPDNPRLWHRLQQPAMRAAFAGLFRELAIRTTKVEVQGEFNLPLQSRFVVPLALSPIERHYYNDTLDRQRAIIARDGGEGVNTATLRACLLQLRQVCTHIQVGNLDNQNNAQRASGRRLNLGNSLLKSMDDALKKMRTEHAAQFLVDTKNHLRALVHRADLLSSQCQLAIDGKAEIDLPAMLALADKKYTDTIAASEAQLPSLREELNQALTANGQAVAGPGTGEDINIIDVDALSEDLNNALASRDKRLSQQQRDRMQEVVRIRGAIRDIKFIMHQAHFMRGVLMGKFGVERKDDEDLSFQKAEDIRKEILASHIHHAKEGVESFKRQIDPVRTKLPIQSIVDLQTDADLLKGGFMTSRLIESVNKLYMILNDNALLLVAWRDEIIELLQKPIEADEEQSAEKAPSEGGSSGIDVYMDEPGQAANADKGGKRTRSTGQGPVVEPEPREPSPGAQSKSKEDEGEEEADLYAQRLETQIKLESYLIAYEAIVADRKEMMDEQRNAIAQQEAGKAIKGRKTRAAADAIKAAKDLGLELREHDGVRTHLIPLMEERETIKAARKGVCEAPLKAYLLNLNNISHSAANEIEKAIAVEACKNVRAYIKAQTERYEALQKELSVFKTAYNKRGRYFAALQEISDTVKDPDFKNGDDLARQIAVSAKEVETLKLSLQAGRTRGRYLAELGAKENQRATAAAVQDAIGHIEDENAECVICLGSSDDKEGLLLGCAHFFCKSCFNAYEGRMTYSGKTCPSCRAEIDHSAIVRFQFGGPDTPADDAVDADAEGSTSGAGNGLASTDEGKKPAASDGDSASALTETAAEGGDEEVNPPFDRASNEIQHAALARLRSLDRAKRARIEEMDMMGEWGTKIDFLIKSLLLSRIETPHARHVVFSNWQDSLKIVVNALRLNGISYASFDTQGGKSRTKDIVDDFIQDKSITVFLLHAERESAGLTLTTCNTVHLLEPVLKHSFELQAIGRVDRLGQKHETSVYCYYTQDTVESRILASNVRSGTSIYLQPSDAESGMAENNMAHVAAGASKGGDLGASEGEDRDLELLSLIL